MPLVNITDEKVFTTQVFVGAVSLYERKKDPYIEPEHTIAFSSFLLLLVPPPYHITA